jgi:hypothetical protein
MSTKITLTKIGKNIFVLLDGEKIARRGRTRWVSLKPGLIVADSADLTKLVIQFDEVLLTLPYSEAIHSAPGAVHFAPGVQ